MPATYRRPGVGTSKRGDPTRLLPGCITDCIEGKARLAYCLQMPSGCHFCARFFVKPAYYNYRFWIHIIHIVLYCTILCYFVFCCTVLYYILFYFISLDCIIIYHNTVYIYICAVLFGKTPSKLQSWVRIARLRFLLNGLGYHLLVLNPGQKPSPKAAR